MPPTFQTHEETFNQDFSGILNCETPPVFAGGVSASWDVGTSTSSGGGGRASGGGSALRCLVAVGAALSWKKPKDQNKD